MSGEDIARASLLALLNFNAWLAQIAIGALAAYGFYYVFKDDDDADAADETPEREQSTPPSSG